MANLPLPISAAAVLAAVALAALAAPQLLRLVVRRRRRRGGAARDRLWNLFYGLDWGEVATNNYGFAPAEGDSPERHQLQMYAELLALLHARDGPGRTTDLLEVSCGRGGGLTHLVRLWSSPLKAIGLDASEQAIAACRRLHGETPGLTFARGSALALPFADGMFDVVINVEASNDYGNFAGFFQEVHRVLRPGGVLLYCDTRRPEEVERVAATMRAAGLQGDWRDITEHVVAACRADTPRRLALIRRRVPWFLRLAFEADLRSYAAVEGSAKFEAFAARKRLYLMTCAVKPPLLLGKPAGRSAADMVAT